MKFPANLIVLVAIILFGQACVVEKKHNSDTLDHSAAASRSEVVNRFQSLVPAGVYQGSFEDQSCSIEAQYPERVGLSLSVSLGEQRLALNLTGPATIDRFNQNGDTDYFLKVFRVSREVRQNGNQPVTHFNRERVRIQRLTDGKLSLSFHNNKKLAWARQWPEPQYATCHIAVAEPDPADRLMELAVQTEDFSVADFDCDSELVEAFSEIEPDYIKISKADGSFYVDFDQSRSTRFRTAFDGRTFRSPILESTTAPGYTLQLYGHAKELAPRDLIERDQPPVGVEVYYKFQSPDGSARCYNDMISGIRF